LLQFNEGFRINVERHDHVFPCPYRNRRRHVNWGIRLCRLHTIGRPSWRPLAYRADRSARTSTTADPTMTEFGCLRTRRRRRCAAPQLSAIERSHVVHIVVSRQLVDLSIDCFVDDGLSLFAPTHSAAIRANPNRDVHSASDVSLESPLLELQVAHCLDHHSALAKNANASFVPARHGSKPIRTSRSLAKLSLLACKAVHIFRKNASPVQAAQPATSMVRNRTRTWCTGPSRGGGSAPSPISMTASWTCASARWFGPEPSLWRKRRSQLTTPNVYDRDGRRLLQH
jgi:hypothetical protein